MQLSDRWRSPLQLMAEHQSKHLTGIGIGLMLGCNTNTMQIAERQLSDRWRSSPPANGRASKQASHHQFPHQPPHQYKMLKTQYQYKPAHQYKILKTPNPKLKTPNPKTNTSVQIRQVRRMLTEEEIKGLSTSSLSSTNSNLERVSLNDQCPLE